MKYVKTINGMEYIFETGRNASVGQAIEGKRENYALYSSIDGYRSTIYFQSTNYFDNGLKNIGILDYDPQTDIITYRKYGFKKSLHEFHRNETIGLNWDVISNLCPKDRVVIEEKTKDKRILRDISVSKILMFQTFKYFKTIGYEKQIFVPVDEFKVIEIPLNSRSRSGKKTGKKRRADN